MLKTQISSAWDDPVVRRVEVNLQGWMQQLTGHADWEVTGEEEGEDYLGFEMRLGSQGADVRLYHNGYAIVDVDGYAVFYGTLTTRTSEYAHLSYYSADSGEPITLN